MSISKSKTLSLLVVSIYYLVSFIASYLIVQLLEIKYMWIYIFLWHLISTLFIFLFSIIHKNSSIYDPFWSVAPIPIVLFLSIHSTNNLLINLLIIIPIILWALRLTLNWIYSWNGLLQEDFRYIDLKDTTNGKAFINNLFGIHIIPTLIVNISLFPISYVLLNSVIYFNLLIFASIFSTAAIYLEYIADKQMKVFRSNDENYGKTMQKGLWKYSRHPNYLGEILFWVGVYLFGVSSGVTPITILICPLLMLALFMFISCPMMDDRSIKKRSDYKDYMNKTSQLLLWPPKKRIG